MIVSETSSVPTRRGSVAKGCLIATVIALVLATAIGIFIWMNARSWIATAAKDGAAAAIAKAPIPEDQKQRITTRINGLAEDFRSNKLTGEQFGKIMEAFVTGPIMPTVMLMGVEKQSLASSGLSAEDKAAGVRTLQRLARAVSEGKIGGPGVREILSPIMRPATGQNDWHFKSTITDEEIRQMLNKAKAQVDLLKIPDEAYQIDIATEIDKAIEAGKKL